ncbi:MAG: C45 family autoproteolytic acyltransferase/hydrolase [Candidatus Dojkabacteria bacterium]|nr:C45 family autoproteolytic acyltransferase/hydrolase [Candidatus Dojkabacteria bacterium]
MKKHNCYYEFKADTHFDLGRQMGPVFKKDTQAGLARSREDNDWKNKRKSSLEYLHYTQDTFPQYIEELNGFAEGADIEFSDLWPMVIGSDLSKEKSEKCTAIITNNGSLIGSTEDFDTCVKDEIYIIKKTIKNHTAFEFYYSYSLGGESISINSNGFVQLTNSLSHTDHQVGIPRNIVSRWLSETSDPEKDFEKLKKLKRASGYSHTLASIKGLVWNIESTAKKATLLKCEIPFVHTNHYLGHLVKHQSEEYKEGVGIGIYERYECASALAKKSMREEKMKELLSDESLGKEKSIFNKRTIARIVIDLKSKTASIWMLREKEDLWLEYILDFI